LEIKLFLKGDWVFYVGEIDLSDETTVLLLEAKVYQRNRLMARV
jgi:hypothetical protein